MKDGIGYVRDEFDYVERKGLWFCDKLIKWMPKDDEDEGQDGDSIKSQDIANWDSNQEYRTSEANKTENLESRLSQNIVIDKSKEIKAIYM